MLAANGEEKCKKNQRNHQKFKHLLLRKINPPLHSAVVGYAAELRGIKSREIKTMLYEHIPIVSRINNSVFQCK